MTAVRFLVLARARDGGEPVGEGPPFGALGVQRCLGALGPGDGGGCEFAGGFLPGLAGSLDRAGLPFGLPAGGGQVRGGALRIAAALSRSRTAVSRTAAACTASRSAASARASAATSPAVSTC